MLEEAMIFSFGSAGRKVDPPLKPTVAEACHSVPSIHRGFPRIGFQKGTLHFLNPKRSHLQVMFGL